MLLLKFERKIQQSIYIFKKDKVLSVSLKHIDFGLGLPTEHLKSSGRCDGGGGWESAGLVKGLFHM